jgi:hypothetical protein
VQSDHLFNAVHDAGGALRAVHRRHEQGAGYMALGAAMATGRPAAYSVRAGPGLPEFDGSPRDRLCDQRQGALPRGPDSVRSNR